MIIHDIADNKHGASPVPVLRDARGMLRERRIAPLVCNLGSTGLRRRLLTRTTRSRWFGILRRGRRSSLGALTAREQGGKRVMSDATVEAATIGAEAARRRERAAPQRSWPSMPKHVDEPIGYCRKSRPQFSKQHAPLCELKGLQGPSHLSRPQQHS